MKYQKTRYVLARVLAAILTLTAVFGLSAPLITQAASNVSVLYRYAAFVNAGGGFAKNFTGEENRTRNGYADVAYALSQKEPKSDRKSGKDNTYWTGLAYAKNLKSVRQQAAEEIASGINRKVSGSSILNSTEGQDAALKQIDDDTTQDVYIRL